MPYRTATFRPNIGVTCPCGEPARELCETCAAWTCGGLRCLYRSSPSRCLTCTVRGYVPGPSWITVRSREAADNRTTNVPIGVWVAVAGLWLVFFHVLGVL